MIKIEDKTKCCGCHGCMNVCPTGAITMEEDSYGFKYPHVDEIKCINCGLCEKVCPIINNKTIDNEPKAYGCYNKNEEVRLNSSSGGIFTLIAEEIISKNGVVYGAAFDNEFSLKHIRVDNVNDLEKLRTSKYLQSTIGDTYKECKKDLDEGKYVLYTGTPCQIEGLLSYLMKDYDNLYTQDIICHGVPSPKVWKHYLNYRKNVDQDTPNNINFRNKDDGWKLFNLKFTYDNKHYSRNQKNDVYMKAFLNNIDLRDSCYNCSFKKENRLSDITLADFWGVQNIAPEIDDNKGTSLIIVNSNKGHDLFESIKDNLIIKDVEFNFVEKTNSSFVKSVAPHKDRTNFMNEISDDNFDAIVNKYIKKPSILKRALRKIKRIIKKIIKK